MAPWEHYLFAQFKSTPLILYKHMECIYTDSCGRKRKGILVTCKECSKEFPTRKDQTYDCCSKKCRSEHQSTKIEYDCAQCQQKFFIRPSRLNGSKSKLLFCSRKCKDIAQRLGGIDEILPSHYGTGNKSTAYRNQYRRLNNTEKLSCFRCGYNEFECGIDIHHKNGDHNDMSKENLLALCAPCHRALHFKFWSL